MARLTDEVRKLFDGKNFAVLSTLEPDGRPHSTVTWVKRTQMTSCSRCPGAAARPPADPGSTGGRGDLRCGQAV